LALRVGLNAYRLTKSIRLHADKSLMQLENCRKACVQADRKLRNVGLCLDQNTKNMVEMARVLAQLGTFWRKKRGQNEVTFVRLAIWEWRQRGDCSLQAMEILLQWRGLNFL
jgi:hypothetical protein